MAADFLHFLLALATVFASASGMFFLITRNAHKRMGHHHD